MSEENVEIVRRALEVQLGSGAGFDLGLLADDFEWILTEGSLEGRSVWRGREEWGEFVRLWTQDFDDFSFQVVRFEWDNGVVFELRDGRVIRATNYLSHAEALEAAGLSE